MRFAGCLAFCSRVRYCVFAPHPSLACSLLSKMSPLFGPSLSRPYRSSTGTPWRGGRRRKGIRTRRSGRLLFVSLVSAPVVDTAWCRSLQAGWQWLKRKFLGTARVDVNDAA